MFKSPESVIWNVLISDASVTSLVGHKIYPHLAQAGDDFPFITWRRTGISREQTLGNPMGVPTVSLSLSIYAASYLSSRKIADAVRNALDGYGGSFDNTEVKRASLTSESDEVIVLEGSEVPTAYSISQDYDILWQEI